MPQEHILAIVSQCKSELGYFTFVFTNTPKLPILMESKMIAKIIKKSKPAPEFPLTYGKILDRDGIYRIQYFEDSRAIVDNAKLVFCFNSGVLAPIENMSYFEDYKYSLVTDEQIIIG